MSVSNGRPAGFRRRASISGPPAGWRRQMSVSNARPAGFRRRASISGPPVGWRRQMSVSNAGPAGFRRRASISGPPVGWRRQMSVSNARPAGFRRQPSISSPPVGWRRQPSISSPPGPARPRRSGVAKQRGVEDGLARGLLDPAPLVEDDELLRWPRRSSAPRPRCRRKRSSPGSRLRPGRRRFSCRTAGSARTGRSIPSPGRRRPPFGDRRSPRPRPTARSPRSRAVPGPGRTSPRWPRRQGDSGSRAARTLRRGPCRPPARRRRDAPAAGIGPSSRLGERRPPGLSSPRARSPAEGRRTSRRGLPFRRRSPRTRAWRSPARVRPRRSISRRSRRLCRSRARIGIRDGRPVRRRRPRFGASDPRDPGRPASGWSKGSGPRKDEGDTVPPPHWSGRRRGGCRNWWKTWSPDLLPSLVALLAAGLVGQKLSLLRSCARRAVEMASGKPPATRRQR